MFFLAEMFGAYRIIEYWLRKRPRRRDILDYLACVGKSLLWGLAMGVYFVVFSAAYGDWLDRPLVIQSEIQSLEQIAGEERYFLNIGADDEEREQLVVDETVFRALNVGDQVELTYLLRQKRVVKCRVLSRAE
ncbi:MAG: hypothetical protein LBT22_02475 [Peptococcaceae bacterium]|nr:hypothetical protein [Peptococcaceae bacterium]